MDYLSRDGIHHSLDLHSDFQGEVPHALERGDPAAARDELPRAVHWPDRDPTRWKQHSNWRAKVTHRSRVVDLYRGVPRRVDVGSLALTSSPEHRGGAGVPLNGTIRMPYEGFVGTSERAHLYRNYADSAGYAARNRPPRSWSRPCRATVWRARRQVGSPESRGIARSLGALLIVDDIFAGCGRTGTFFSFERLGIEPDIVCISKSIGGIGLPLAMLLIRPDCDVWNPGEHNGTFRGNNLAMVAATAALGFWEEPQFLAGVQTLIRTLEVELGGIVREFAECGVRAVGRGALRGIALVAARSCRRGCRLRRSATG